MQQNLTILIGLVLAQVVLPSPKIHAQPGFKTNSLTFIAVGTNGFAFNTGALRGKLRADGKAKGLSDIQHIATGATLDRSMGLFGHYRVFTANKRYGTGAWDWPGEAKLQADGSVEACWSATEGRPFELRANYRWATPNSLDLVTTVLAKTNLAKFESFLASYFAEGFTNSLACVAEPPANPNVPGFVAADSSFGAWLVFPRDDAAMAVFRDGRWTIPPNPVAWAQMARLAKPLGIRRDPTTGLTAVIMSPPGHVFALCTPHQTEGHRSMYLSLFGRDLKPGETARAHARLVISEKLTDTEALKVYETYLQQLGGK